jgi:hypothetical protein
MSASDVAGCKDRSRCMRCVDSRSQRTRGPTSVDALRAHDKRPARPAGSSAGCGRCSGRPEVASMPPVLSHQNHNPHSSRQGQQGAGANFFSRKSTINVGGMPEHGRDDDRSEQKGECVLHSRIDCLFHSTGSRPPAPHDSRGLFDHIKASRWRGAQFVSRCNCAIRTARDGDCGSEPEFDTDDFKWRPAIWATVGLDTHFSLDTH